MPLFELHLFAPGSNQPFASLPQSATSFGSFSAGESIVMGAGKNLTIGKVAHRCFPGPANEPILQTALLISGPALGLTEESFVEPWIKPAGDFVPWPWLLHPEFQSQNPSGTVYEGVGTTLEEALKFAHAQVPLREHRDFTVSKVVGWGLQRGGFTNQTRFYVQVEEDSNAHMRPDMPKDQQIRFLSGYIAGNR